MATVNRTSGSENQKFQQIESDSWSNIYLPAICAGIIMTVVLLMAVSCSKKSDNPVAKISPPVSQTAETSAPAAIPAAVPEAAKKVVKKHRPANATYMNGTYGVSFSYPRKYSLQSGDKQKEMPIEAGFAKPGAVEIVSVDMPDSGYPQTDFSSALLNVSVNTGMSAEECGQFVPASKEQAAKSDLKTEQKSTTDASTKSADEAVKSSGEAVKPTLIKLGSNDFSEIEQMKAAGEQQSDVKYFHLFKNGACYEFALDVETFRKGDEDLAQVDRGQVFKQLEKILTSARIKDVELPGTVKTETASTSQPTVNEQSAATTQPAESVNTTSLPRQTEKAQVITPEQK